VDIMEVSPGTMHQEEVGQIYMEQYLRIKADYHLDGYGTLNDLDQSMFGACFHCVMTRGNHHKSDILNRGWSLGLTEKQFELALTKVVREGPSWDQEWTDKILKIPNFKKVLRGTGDYGTGLQHLRTSRLTQYVCIKNGNPGREKVITETIREPFLDKLMTFLQPWRSNLVVRQPTAEELAVWSTLYVNQEYTSYGKYNKHNQYRPWLAIEYQHLEELSVYQVFIMLDLFRMMHEHTRRAQIMLDFMSKTGCDFFQAMVMTGIGYDTYPHVHTNLTGYFAKTNKITKRFQKNFLEGNGYFRRRFDGLAPGNEIESPFGAKEKEFYDDSIPMVGYAFDPFKSDDLSVSWWLNPSEWKTYPNSYQGPSRVIGQQLLDMISPQEERIAA